MANPNCQCQLIVWGPAADLKFEPDIDPGEPQKLVRASFREIFVAVGGAQQYNGRITLVPKGNQPSPPGRWSLETLSRMGQAKPLLEFREIDVLPMFTGKAPVMGPWNTTLIGPETTCDTYHRFQFRAPQNIEPNHPDDPFDFYRIRLKWPHDVPDRDAAICIVSAKVLRMRESLPDEDEGIIIVGVEDEDERRKRRTTFLNMVNPGGGLDNLPIAGFINDGFDPDCAYQKLNQAQKDKLHVLHKAGWRFATKDDGSTSYGGLDMGGRDVSNIDVEIEDSDWSERMASGEDVQWIDDRWGVDFDNKMLYIDAGDCDTGATIVGELLKKMKEPVAGGIDKTDFHAGMDKWAQFGGGLGDIQDLLSAGIVDQRRWSQVGYLNKEKILGALQSGIVEVAGSFVLTAGFGALGQVLKLFKIAKAMRSMRGVLAGKRLDAGLFAQKTFSPTFAEKGLLQGAKFDDVVKALKNGNLKVDAMGIDYITKAGRTYIVNTRSAMALQRAGISRSQWKVLNRTGMKVYEDRVAAQLARNGMKWGDGVADPAMAK